MRPSWPRSRRGGDPETRPARCPGERVRSGTPARSGQRAVRDLLRSWRSRRLGAQPVACDDAPSDGSRVVVAGLLCQDAHRANGCRWKGRSLPEVDATAQAEEPPGLSPPLPRRVPDTDLSYSDVKARSSVDTMLRNTQQQLVALSGQADLKASLLTTAAAVVASIAASHLGDSDIKWAAGTLLVFLVAALLASVLAVFPKFEVHREPEGELPPNFNPLFFGHYARIPKQRYLDEMLRVVADDSASIGRSSRICAIRACISSVPSTDTCASATPSSCSRSCPPASRSLSRRPSGSRATPALVAAARGSLNAESPLG